jgi:hypothetical protein
MPQYNGSSVIRVICAFNRHNPRGKMANKGRKDRQKYQTGNKEISAWKSQVFDMTNRGRKDRNTKLEIRKFLHGIVRSSI